MIVNQLIFLCSAILDNLKKKFKDQNTAPSEMLTDKIIIKQIYFREN